MLRCPESKACTLACCLLPLLLFSPHFQSIGWCYPYSVKILSCPHETSSGNTPRNTSRRVLYESSSYFLNQPTTALIPLSLYSTNLRVDTNVTTPENGHYSTKHRADIIRITSEIGDYSTNHRPDTTAITSEVRYYLRLGSCVISPHLNQVLILL